jgi:hypothetical protein
MPINIYKKDDFHEVDFICDNDWDLPTQISELKNWLKNKQKELPKDNYIADIGFEIRKKSTGGGAILDSEMLEILSKIGMEIYLSEYDPTSDI